MAAGPTASAPRPGATCGWCAPAGSYIARIDLRTGDSLLVQPPTAGQGARRVWSDSRGRIWVAEWASGQLSMHDPASGQWRAWKPPVDHPRTHAVHVDERDIVWISEWASNATVSFDPARERFERFAMPREGAHVRQILGRKGEVWLPESGTEHLSVIRS